MAATDPRFAGVDPTSRRDVWVKKLVYPGHTVPTAVAPAAVAVGLAVHDGVFAPGPAAAALAFGWLVQLGGVLADNYVNLRRYRNDAEHPALVYALDHGVITLAEVATATGLAFAAAALVGGYLIYLGGLPVIVVGLASMGISLLYSLEVTDVPLHDGYFFLFFGPVSVGGTYYIQAVSVLADPVPLGLPPGTLPPVAVLLGVPVGALTTAILVVDNVRDLEFDRAKADRTLAVVVGERWSRRQYEGLLVAAYASLLVIWLGTRLGGPVLVPLATGPLAVRVAGRMRAARDYHALLSLSPATGRLLVAFSVLLGVGVAL